MQPDVFFRKVTIGSDLEHEKEKRLMEFLRNYKDVFVWSSKDLPGVDRTIIEHKLSISPTIRSKKQKLRKMSEEKVKVSSNEIEANPDKINAILDMEEPKSIRDVQKLSGRIAALNRFIAKAAERTLPFFVILRNATKFEWGREQSEAFQELYLMQS